MTNMNSRRRFLGTAGVAGGCLMLCPLLQGDDAAASAATTAPALPDFSKLTYCCYQCNPEQCPALKATLANDPDGKAKQLAEWREKQAAKVAAWEKEKGRPMTPEDVFCYGCKEEGDRLSPVAAQCTTRACVIERKLVSCAHCDELETCQKDLWVSYPKFREHVLGIRKALLAAQAS
jgi:hypothetical protein